MVLQKSFLELASFLHKNKSAFVDGAVSGAEVGAACIMKVAVRCFEKSTGKPGAGATVLEKALEGLAQKDVFCGNLMGGASVQVSLEFCVKLAGQLQVTDCDGSILWKVLPMSSLCAGRCGEVSS